MATYDCDDFRISFDRGPGGGDTGGSGPAYGVVARMADGREVRSAFALPVTTEALEAAVLQLGRSRSVDREVAPEMITERKANAEELGDTLAKALFSEEIGALYDEARRSAAAQGRGVRLTLSLASTPELLSVPWELLYRRPSFLASQRRSPVVRYLEIGDVPPPACIEGPVRVLGVVSSPPGLPELDVEEERARVERALDSMIKRGLVELDWCDPATPKSLRERLRDGSYHVLHYVGHSDFTHDGEGLLFLMDEAGGAARVTEAVLTNLLGDQTSLRLAVLNSCEGARTTLTDPFAGIATSLVALGVPAVVAMQFAISDRAAIVFAEELFTSLIGRQYPIDAAVAEARKAVFTEVNEIEWATPVLFLRSETGELFDFRSNPIELPLPVAPTPISPDHLDSPTVAAPLLAPPPPPPPAAPAGPATPPQGTPATPAPAAPPKRRRGRVLVSVGVLIAIVAAGAAFLATRDNGDDGNGDVVGEETFEEETFEEETFEEETFEEETFDEETFDGFIDIDPTSGPVGSSIEIQGTACPELPDGWSNLRVTYYLTITDSTDDVAVDEFVGGDEDWSATLDIPEDLDLDFDYDVGASCFGDDDTGETFTYYDFDKVPFEVTSE